MRPNTLFEKTKIQINTEIASLKYSSDTLLMIQSVKGFLHWYKNNYAKANSFGFTYQDKQGNYQVSVNQGKEYLKFLKSSGFISDKYVDIWLQYFKDKSKYLVENLQNEGPP